MVLSLEIDTILVMPAQLLYQTLKELRGRISGSRETAKTFRFQHLFCTDRGRLRSITLADRRLGDLIWPAL